MNQYDGRLRQETNIEVLTEDECFELLTTTSIGRVGFATDQGVSIIPVTFVLHGRRPCFRTSPDGILAFSTPNNKKVAFEVDYHSDLYPTGWSVLMHGSVEAMEPEDVAQLNLGRLLMPWAGGDRGLHLRFVPVEVSGRRVRRR